MIPPPAEPRKILVIMLRRIGDVLLTTPALRALRKLFPRARIDFLVESPGDQVLRENPDLDRVLLYRGGWDGLASLARIRREGYDWVIDYMGNPRSALLTRASRAPVRAGPAHAGHRWAYTHPLRESEKPYYSAREKIRVLAGLGLKPDESDSLPVWRARAEEERWAQGALQGLRLEGEGPLVGLAPASRRETRRWPAASYASLGRSLRERLGARLLVFWGPGELALAQEVAGGIGEGARPSPETPSLGQLAALIGRCDLLVTNCNGPKHIAVSRGVATLTLHGSSDPACWNPPGEARHPVARLDDLHCIGCRLNDCPYDLECMRLLTPESVFEKARKILEGSKNEPNPAKKPA